MLELPQINSKKSLVEKAYETIKKAILEMKVEPGEALTEEKLVEQLGISRTPIRSALNKLAHEELVEVYQGKGTYVASVSYEKMKDTLAVRESLEILASRLATRKNNNKMKLKKLKDLILRQEELLKKSKENYDILEFVHYDNRFHHYIAKMSENEVLTREISNLKNQFNRFVILSKSLQNKERITGAVKEHHIILKSIKSGKEDEAISAMRNHIRNVKSGIEEGLKDYLNEK